MRMGKANNRAPSGIFSDKCDEPGCCLCWKPRLKLDFSAIETRNAHLREKCEGEAGKPAVSAVTLFKRQTAFMVKERGCFESKKTVIIKAPQIQILQSKGMS